MLTILWMTSRGVKSAILDSKRKLPQLILKVGYVLDVVELTHLMSINARAALLEGQRLRIADMFIIVLFFAIVLVYLLAKLFVAMVEYISDAWRSKEKDRLAASLRLQSGVVDMLILLLVQLR